MEPDRGGMRALLAANLPRRHAFTARTEHLAGLSRQPQLRSRNAEAGPLPRASIAAAGGVPTPSPGSCRCPTGEIMKVRFGVSIISGTAFPHRRGLEKF